MTYVIKVLFDESDMDMMNDFNRRASINWRLKYFEEVMSRGALYWEVDKDPEKEPNGDGRELAYVFYINEFYVDIVLDLLNDDYESDAEWRDWFCQKYGVKVA